MEIIETITHLDSAQAKFIVNNALPSVPVTYAGITQGNLVNAEAKNYFVPGDNILIMSCGYTLPMGFDIYKTESTGLIDTPIVGLQGKSVLGATIFFIEPGLFYLHLPNYEIAIGRYLGYANEKMRLNSLFFNTLNISMVGVPATLNGVEFKIPIWFKVAHNFPMVN